MAAPLAPFTLIVVIITSGQPASFDVKYPTREACLEGRKIALNMSIEPVSQEIHAACLDQVTMKKWLDEMGLPLKLNDK